MDHGKRRRIDNDYQGFDKVGAHAFEVGLADFPETQN